ncbi:MAG: amidohydrolase family protein [Nitrospinota bacterium]
MIIDVHNHFIGDAAKEFLVREGKAQGIDAREDDEGGLVVDLGFRDLKAGRAFLDPDVRLEAMKARGIDAQLVTYSASHLFCDKDAGFTAEYLAVANDGAAALAEKHPGKFYPTAALPLQDISASVREAERAVNRLNARAVFLPSNVGEAHLDDSRFDPLYEAVQGLGVPLIVHPATPVSRHGMEGYHLFNICGFMFDQTLNFARMVLTGVFERFPRLQAFYTHAGGTAPFLRGRWDHAFNVREDTRAGAPRPPSAYLGQVWLGTMVFYPPTLEFVIRSAGVDRVCLGSDYPYDMADPDPVGTVRAIASLSDPEVNAVLGGNAKVLFGLWD